MTSNIVNSGLSGKTIFTEALFSRPESLSKYLPYDEFIKDENLFLMKDGSLGAVYKVRLVEHEPLVASKIVDSVSSLKTWLGLPSSYTLQLLFDQRIIGPLDKRWDELLNDDKGHVVSKLLHKEAVERTRKNSPYERVLYLAIRNCSVDNKSFVSNFFKKGEALLFDETKYFVKRLREFKAHIADLECNSSLKMKKVTGCELVRLLRKEFNPKTFYKREFAKYNDEVSISKQVIYNSPKLSFEGISREGVKTRAISLKMAPSFAYAGGTASFLELDFPFKISISFSFPEKDKIKKFYDVKEFLLDKTQTAKGRRQLKEIREAQEKLAHDDRVLYMTYTVIIEGETENELDEKERKVANVFNNKLESEVISDKDIGLGLYFNSLPLCYTPEADLSASRFIRILKSDAIKFLPIFDSFRGYEKGLQLYTSRENNLALFSLILNEISNHTVVIADSGSGKSSFIIDCVQALKRLEPEPLIFAIEKKASHKIIGKYFDADMTIFDPNEDIPFSPFRGVYDEGKISFLTQLLITAIKLTSPNFVVESEHIAAITKSLKLAYKSAQNQRGLEFLDGELVESSNDENVEISVDGFISELSGLTSLKEFEKLEDKIEEVLNKLKPFYGDGLYSKYFKSCKSSIANKDTRYFVYDLDSLDSDPVLQTLMTMSVMEEIRQTIKLPENKGRGGFVIIEELGMLGRTNSEASKFIIDAAETFRKLGVFLIGLTPRPQNYFEIEAGKAMWQVADNYIFMKMSPDNVEYLKSKSSLLDEANTQIIKSLDTVKDKYAEVFYVNKNKSNQGAFRFWLTPFKKWLAPTNMKDMEKVEDAFVECRGDKWEVMRFLTKDIPSYFENLFGQEVKA
jgi:hypothetical protein